MGLRRVRVVTGQESGLGDGPSTGHVYEGELPSQIHVANETIDANGQRVFEVYNPDRDGPDTASRVVYGT